MPEEQTVHVLPCQKVERSRLYRGNCHRNWTRGNTLLNAMAEDLETSD